MKKIFIENADGTFTKKYRCPCCKELFDEEYNVKSAYCKVCTITKVYENKAKRMAKQPFFFVFKFQEKYLKIKERLLLCMKLQIN